MGESTIIRIITREKLESLIEKSRSSERKRAPFPVHPDEYSGPQYLINPIQPDSYIQPHKHPHPEIWIPVRGRTMLVCFEDNGEILDRNILSARDVTFYEMPSQRFHTAFALEKDSVFANVSQGPFNPQTSKISAEWAPPEKDKVSWEPYLLELKRKIIGIH